MIPAEELFVSGRFDEAMEAVKNNVRNDSASAKPRIFLFQLLCIQGQWDRALTQLNVIGDLDKTTQPMVQTYREALRCEVLRAEIFRGLRLPMVFGEPDPWIAILIESLQQIAAGKFAAAAALRDEAFANAPPESGTIDGQKFEWIADADPRLGPVIEVVVSGRYYWAPYSRIQSIHIEPPADLRDMVWLPAEFTWSNGGQAVGLIPTRYPGSENNEDIDIRLARKTVWTEPAHGTYLGAGQRVLATDIGDYSLLDVRSVEFDSFGSGGEAISPAE